MPYPTIDFIHAPAFWRTLLIGLCLLGVSPYVHADDYKSAANIHYDMPSPNITGTLGLNTIPNARMDEKGAVRLGAATSDPYTHSFIGFQLATPLYVSFRQTAEGSSLFQDPDNLLPGVDVKLRLAEETATRPAFVLGLDSAVGHKKMASEYLAFSKRYNNFDLTGGIAWGRLGSQGHLKNPLAAISSHFEKPRSFTSPLPQTSNQWFTGEEIGFFGGVEYFTPIKGLSLKADYNADDYIGERATIAGFNAPAPWSVGVNYKPIDQIDISAGIVGGEKIMAHLNLQDQLFDWPVRAGQKLKTIEIISPRPQNKDGKSASKFTLLSYKTTGEQIGNVASLIANTMPQDSEKISIALTHKGLQGPEINLIRRDLERAKNYQHGSPEEIWRDTTIIPASSGNLKPSKATFKNFKTLPSLRFILDNRLSFTEADTGFLYRSGAVVELEKPLFYGLYTGSSVRAEITNNLGRLNKFRFASDKPVRSNENIFASQRLSVDRFYLSWLRSVTGDTHIGLSGGYLEDMFMGYGAEILYRPFNKRFALGAEGWRAYRRDPDSTMNLKFYRDATTSGHLNLFYEMPNNTTTLYGKVGRYLREDFGATFGIKNIFDNGATLDAHMTLSDQPDVDILGDRTYLFGGVRLSIPLGSLPFIPDGSEVRFASEPFARDTGQFIKSPQPLYEVTEPIASRSIHRSWSRLLD